LSPRLVALLGLAAVAALVGGAGASGPSRKPGASAQAWAVRVVVPGSDGGGTATVVAPPAASPSLTGGFSYPGDGSVITTGATSASATTAITVNASAKAASDVASVSIFGGEITVSAVAARASGGTGPSGAGGNFNGTSVVGLNALGQSAASGRVSLADWGYLTIDNQGVDASAPEGAKGYRGFVTALDIHLNADHGGLPAGSEIQLGYAEAAVQTAPHPVSTAKVEPVPSSPAGPAAGDRPQDRPRRNGLPVKSPLRVHPKLTAGHYVYPVYGPSSYIDTYGAARSDVTYHHGDDIFGQLGQPLVACADGTVFSIGWNKVGGNRLWIRDGAGNEFYYAHLSAFSTLAVNGAHVKAGQVVGFMGNTGDAEGTPYHLHFEIHPVSLLYLGYDGAVDPTAYLDAWSHAQDLPFPIGAGWAPVVPGSITAPEPGAILLGMSDISSADGLDPASLRRALAPAPTGVSGLPSSGLPTTVAPKSDLGRG
jgi:murein DD-endopeptidase MepM/ murein hydrolase activator NlpD